MTRKLTHNDVVMIKELATKMTMKKVGNLFGISSTTVFRIVNNQTYNKPENPMYLPYDISQFNHKEVKTKRVYELIKGDVFVLANVRWIVYAVKQDRILYRAYLPNPQGSGRYSFGAKNQMKVGII